MYGPLFKGKYNSTKERFMATKKKKAKKKKRH